LNYCSKGYLHEVLINIESHIRMPPVRRDQLVVGQEYYLRDEGDVSEGPWGVLGLQPFTYDGDGSFHITTNPIANLNSFGGNWLFYPIADGPPVPPAPLPPPLPPALPYGGHLLVSDNAKNAISYDDIAEGDELVNWNIQNDPQGRRESNFGYYYTKDTYNRLPDPKTSPITRGLITNPKLYTALLPASPNSSLFERTRSKRTRSKRKGKSRKNKLRKRSIYN